MAKDPAFLFYPGDYLRDTQVLSSNAQVAYDRIMCEHMRNICISKKRLDFLTKRLTEDEKLEVMSVLTTCAGGFQIEWVAASISKRRAYSESRRSNRRSKKEEESKNICKSYDSHMENENEIDSSSLVLTSIGRETFFKDLPNSQQLEIVCMDLGLTKDQVLGRVPDFRKAAEIDYPDAGAFYRHLKNWLRKNPAPTRGRFTR